LGGSPTSFPQRWVQNGGFPKVGPPREVAQGGSPKGVPNSVLNVGFPKGGLT
jgi:hypothetical protein